ncbi:MAG: tetratricopeptide repeat protein [Planctomycetes bacterium]|nr:tetratricopeptide repeat protein [Planctomycetota bacterium]
MNSTALRCGFVELLTEVRSAGPAAPPEAIERAFDRCFPALLVAADPYDQDELGDSARERICAAILATATASAPRAPARRWPWFAALAAGLLVALTLWRTGVLMRQRSEPGALALQAATFSLVTGTPGMLVPGAGTGVQAQPGLAVPYGARVSTGDADLAELRFADGTTLRLGFNTTVELPAPRQLGQPLPRRPYEVRLTAGRILARVSHLDDEPRFAIDTPVATAEVLGTEFSLAIDSDTGPSASLRAVLDVRRGRVAFSNALGRVLATDLMRSSATEGEAPTEPQRVRAFRSFHHLEDAGLSWTNAPLAIGGACQWTSPPPGLASLSFRDTPDGRVVLRRVLGGSNAATAGLRAGDEIRAISGDTVTDAWSATVEVLRRPERTVTVAAARDGMPFLATFRVRAPSPGDLDDGLRLEQQIGTEALLALGRDREPARRALEQLVARAPHPAYWNNLALFWQTDDRMGNALRCFAQAVRLAPRTALFHFNYGGALQAIGNLQRAAAELREAARLEPQWPTPRLALVDTLLLLDDPQAALDALTGLAQSSPEDATNVALRRSKALVRLGRTAEAQTELEHALEVEPDSPAVLGALATTADVRRDVDAAIRYLERAYALDPDSAVYANNLGSLYWREARFAEAEPVLRRAIELEPTDPVAYMNLGLVLQSTGQLGQAEKQYRLAIEVNPEYASTYVNYGYLLLGTPRVDEAERLLRKALELDPRHTMGCANLGTLLSDHGRREEAVALYREFLRVTPDVGTIQNNLAEDLGRLGTDLDEALDLARAAVAAAPQRPTRHSTLGIVLAARGDLQEAETALTEAVELFGEVEDAAGCWHELGSVRERRGNPEGAREAYRKAVILDPALDAARAALQRLGG